MVDQCLRMTSENTCSCLTSSCTGLISITSTRLVVKYKHENLTQSVLMPTELPDPDLLILDCVVCLFVCLPAGEVMPRKSYGWVEELRSDVGGTSRDEQYPPANTRCSLPPSVSSNCVFCKVLRGRTSSVQRKASRCSVVDRGTATGTGTSSPTGSGRGSTNTPLALSPKATTLSPLPLFSWKDRPRP